MTLAQVEEQHQIAMDNIEVTTNVVCVHVFVLQCAIA